MNAIVPVDFNEMQLVARAMATSGFFQDTKQESQAIVKVLAGREMGLGPFASMTGIHIIQGRPALSANLIATLIKNDPRYNYKVLQLDEKACSIDFYENGEKIGNSTFTLEDAKKAQTKNLDKFPKNMLFARAISNGAKWYTPGIFGGNPVYTPEELGASIDQDGNVIEGAFVETPAPVSKPNGSQVSELDALGAQIWNGKWETVKPALMKKGKTETGAMKLVMDRLAALNDLDGLLAHISTNWPDLVSFVPLAWAKIAETYGLVDALAFLSACQKAMQTPGFTAPMPPDAADSLIQTRSAMIVAGYPEPVPA